jgi:short-subunit dehydrogenase
VDALLNSHDGLSMSYLLLATLTIGIHAVRLVISNAGTSTPLPYSLLETPTELAECIVNVNLTSSVLLAQTVLNHWHQQPADTQDKALVFVSSMAGLTPAPYCSVYGATKAALVSLAASLTLETPSHVHVQACCPGMVQAGNTQRWFGSARCQVMDVATPAQAAKNILLGLGCDQWRTTTSGIHVGYMFLMQMLPAWLSGRIVRHEHEKARLRLGMTT